MDNTPNLKSGTCPRCGSNEVYTTHGILKRGERMILPVSSWKMFFLDTYICATCGHFEEFINDDDLKDQNIIDGIKKELRKV
jgi:predicted nucleic-acid-binding Zn-ribbon protein